MKVGHNVAELQNEHVEFELECIDRMYLNLYIPGLQTPEFVAHFIKTHLGKPIASSAVLAPISDRFVKEIKSFCKEHEVEMVRFKKKQSKEEVAKAYLEQFVAEHGEESEGLLFVGVAQEKAPVVRTMRKDGYPWLYRSTAMVNYYYFYCYDRHFGPLFIKYCSYFPYNGKLCLNGHEYLKRQLAIKGIDFEALDNGLLSCERPAKAQGIAGGLGEKQIKKLFERWSRWLPHPFTPKEQRHGFRHDISVLQAEFALTQVWDQPRRGREFFESVIAENIDLGRPEHIGVIFNRRVIKTTPGRFRARVLRHGAIPSLHLDYKKTRLKQYFKEGRALRTETTINDTRDFEIGRRLTEENLHALRGVGFKANKRLLDAQKTSHDCLSGAQAFEGLQKPVELEKSTSGTKVPSLRFGAGRTGALMAVILMLAIRPGGFRNRDLRPLMAQLLGQDPDYITPGKASYDLRRLRAHGLIKRIEGTHRYEVTDRGLIVASFLFRVEHRVIGEGLCESLGPEPPPGVPANLHRACQSFLGKLDHFIQSQLAPAG